ncbi:MAG: BtrH N-terminal domain-containing protein [Gammaproteobacteria bacterium]|nr:BtrH N-terminal domain-containing protein [Gammaproteobacteria bacterium]
MQTSAADFEHRQAAHCESGAITSLLRHYGLDISEPMAFGLSSSLSFAYLPFIKIAGLPLIAYRMPPKSIVKGLQKSLGVRMHSETFRSPTKGMARLDELLAQGQVVGLQTSVFWLPYFPENMRFHFNAHNLIVYGRDGDEYLISDPVAEMTVRCARADLERARFAKGTLAPKGLLYYPAPLSQATITEKMLRTAIWNTVKVMLYTPLPIIGVKGIRMLARRIAKLKADDLTFNKMYIGHIVRMQEEIGTGGAGFRFIYAAFLQEVAKLLNDPRFEKHADNLVVIGDQWREFALNAALMCKARKAFDASALSQQLVAIADAEKIFFNQLKQDVK